MNASGGQDVVLHLLDDSFTFLCDFRRCPMQVYWPGKN